MMAAMALETPAKSNPLASIGGIVGALVGALVGQYCWAQMLVPAVAGGLAFLLFVKTPIKPPRFAGAIAVTIGHVAWFVVAAAMLQAWAGIAIDIAVLTVAIALLWARPSVATAALLAVVELASLVFNVMQILPAPLYSAEHRALTVHILLRLMVLGALGVGLLSLRKPPAAPDT